MAKECTINGCSHVARRRGYCDFHYERWRYSGDPLVGREDLGTRLERFSFPEPNSGCWLWTGNALPSGYGTVWADRTNRLAHRVSYKYHVGPIPAGMELDHLCRTRCCVNPAHLEPVTRAENARRSPISGHAKTHCCHGHEYNQATTYISRKTGKRHCRTCARDAARNYQKRKRLNGC
jgi:hypothetical protein